MADIQDPLIIKKLATGVITAGAANGKGKDVNLINPNSSFFNNDFSQIRSASNILTAIRTLARVHGDTAAAIASQVRLADTELRISVYDAEHQLSGDGSNLLRSILQKIDIAADYSLGYNSNMTLKQVKQTLLRSVALTGGSALELVLDKARLPMALRPVSVEKLFWKTTDQSTGIEFKVVPYMKNMSGANIVLDIPTFFYSSLDQELETTYSTSPIESSVNSAVANQETVNDVRRAVKRSGHSRMIVTLLTEQLMKSCPIDIRSDPEKLTAWVENTRLAVQSEIENLSPESALVMFDSLKAEYLNSEIGAKADYTSLINMMDGILSTSLRTPPTVLGKQMGGTQSTASTESLLFVKTAEGIQTPVEDVLTRAFTLMLRLYGFDGYVSVNFTPVDLRPDSELEAFKTMRQQRILELLSYGFITDDEAAEMLGTGPRAPNAPPLSGTMFTQTGTMKPPDPNADPQRRALTTDTPKSAGGKDNATR